MVAASSEWTAKNTTEATPCTDADADAGFRGPLKVKRLSEFAVLPQRGSVGAAGYDLSSAHDCTVPAGGNLVVKTDLSVALPADCYARIAPRSSLAVRHMISTAAGVVDSDYRGNIGVVLFNHGPTDFKVERGDRIAQMILERIYTPQVEEVDELDKTERNDGGYGSTGKRKFGRI
mmetsp:Transcript_5138/g.15367  ORF Transcript_5138/g.15367 Transcript_5138/m.15367 type:complete len:176 (-) Transcript_5138:779-1306(-)